jgi:hypothetical protein
MDVPPKEGPEIIAYRIPRIEVYQVTDDELNRIEEGYAQVGQDLTFATTSLSLGLAPVIAILTANFSEKARLLLIAIVAILRSKVSVCRNQVVAPPKDRPECDRPNTQPKE